MFGLLNTTQIYGIQSQHKGNEPQFEITYRSSPHSSSATSSASRHHHNTKTNSPASANDCPSKSRSSPHGSEETHTNSKFLSTLTSKSPTNFLEKFLKSDLLQTYDTLKNYRNFSAATTPGKRHSDPLQHHSPESLLTHFNCLQGSYRHSFDGEFYEKVQVTTAAAATSRDCQRPKDMTVKCSKNLLAVEPEVQGPATLQNYQKIPESEHDMLVDSLVASSGASSGEFNSSSDTTTTTQSSSNGGNGGGSSSFSSSSSNLYKRLSFGGRNSQNAQNKQDKHNDQAQYQQEGLNDNSIILNLTSVLRPGLKAASDLHRSSSSTSSAGDFLSKRERKKGAMTPQPTKTPLSQLFSPTSNSKASTPQPQNAANLKAGHSNSNNNNTKPPTDKAQRRKLLQMLAAYEQQNKFLQRELAKEKRRRSEELACVVKSLLCFESKLKTDMKAVNQRLLEKDGEICRLVRQNKALRKRLAHLKAVARECTRDEGVVEDGEVENDMDCKELKGNEDDDEEMECLVLEALQCINCQRQFYDIEVHESSTQTVVTLGGSGGGGAAGTGGNGSGSLKESSGNRNNDDPTTEHGSSSDDTVSSSFFGARRSVRYTSKRTSGTFRDYMRSRAMNIDDPSLDADDDDRNSEEYPPSASSRDGDTDKLNIYSRTIERMHGVKCDSERESEEHSGLDTSSSSAVVTRSNSRASTKSSKSSSSKLSELSNALEEDDGIFSPTQDEDFEEEEEEEEQGVNGCRLMEQGKLKIVRGRALEAFSEASPKQIYETSTDDWYASASDQEEIGTGGTVTSSKSYGQGAVNPVLECVNQILLQQSMEGIEDRSQTPKSVSNNTSNSNLPRRSSLSDRRSNSRSNSRASDAGAPNSRGGTLTRKRVHFSTKNSMVHVPRNDETEEDEDEQEGTKARLISNCQSLVSYIGHSPAKDTELLEVFNYESIYSNEYEPIGSELNSSNLYVDMEAAVKVAGSESSSTPLKASKLPPALPPKPANLLKFKKSLQQLDESPDEHMEANAGSSNGEALVEPDYCSISEVNVGITSVQIRADIHRTPPSETDLESVAEQDLDTATVVSEALSQKTEEIEEIFADIPKLPNVAAIIAPKSALKQQSDYLVMTAKAKEGSKMELGLRALADSQKPDRSALKLNLNTAVSGLLGAPLKSPKMDSAQMLRLNLSSANYQQHYKRKHMPNILQEINKRLSLPNSPVTPSPPMRLNGGFSNSSGCQEQQSPLQNLPLQAEFDWYNLDAEYGKHSQSELAKVCDIMGTNGMPSLLTDIKEDGESLLTTADEYNLDEEYGNELAALEQDKLHAAKLLINSESLCEAINPTALVQHAKAKKIKKNLANFEKFIENTSVVVGKPMPTKRKIYFAGPFV